jgi:hypothetical protein
MSKYNAEYSKKYREANLESLKLYQKRYRKEHADHLRELKRQWIKANPGKVREYSRRRCERVPTNVWRYGITEAEYFVIYKKQEGLCAICRRPQAKPWHWLCVDHDHKTGKLRGLTCMRCNTALGWFEALRETVLKYLEVTNERAGQSP